MARTRRRWRLSRAPFAFWLAVAVLASATGLVVAGALSRVDALAARYGPLRPVVVASHPVDPGSALTPGDLAVRRLPASFVPAGSFARVDEVRGRAPVVPLVAGAPVLPGHLAPDGLSGAAALLPAGGRAVEVPTGSASPALRVGDVVDAVATFDDELAATVAAGAAVVDVGPDTATLAVTPAEARAVAYALTKGAVTILLSADRSPGSAGSPRPPPGGTPRRG